MEETKDVTLQPNIDGKLVYQLLVKVHAMLILQRMDASDFVAVHGETPELVAIQKRGGEAIAELLKVVDALFIFTDEAESGE